MRYTDKLFTYVCMQELQYETGQQLITAVIWIQTDRRKKGEKRAEK